MVAKPSKRGPFRKFLVKKLYKDSVLDIFLKIIYAGREGTNYVFFWYVVRFGRIMRYGSIMRRFVLSCICPVYFLHKSTEFQDMQMECQIILIHFFLLISHKFLVIANHCPLPYLLPNILYPIDISIANQFMVYSCRRW